MKNERIRRPLFRHYYHANAANFEAKTVRWSSLSFVGRISGAKQVAIQGFTSQVYIGALPFGYFTRRFWCSLNLRYDSNAHYQPPEIDIYTSGRRFLREMQSLCASRHVLRHIL